MPIPDDSYSSIRRVPSNPRLDEEDDFADEDEGLALHTLHSSARSTRSKGRFSDNQSVQSMSLPDETRTQDDDDLDDLVLHPADFSVIYLPRPNTHACP